VAARPTRYVTARAAVVRDGPTGQARKVGMLPKGCELAALDRAHGWRYVRATGARAPAGAASEGWVYLRNLRPAL
jgi:hypothetical protein